jgi:hypothetical protein
VYVIHAWDAVKSRPGTEVQGSKIINPGRFLGVILFVQVGFCRIFEKGLWRANLVIRIIALD